MALTTGQTTLTTLRLAAQQRADMEGSPVISDAEWDRNINASAAELYDLLVTTYGDDFYVSSPYTIMTDGTSERYALPSDFYKLLGAEWWAGGTAASAVRMLPFSRGERNMFSDGLGVVARGRIVPRYRVDGSSLWLIPRPPPAGLTIVLDYVPRFVPMQGLTITCDQPVPGDTVTFTGTSGIVAEFGSDFTSTSSVAAAAYLAAAINDLKGNWATASGAVVTIDPTALLATDGPYAVTASATTRTALSASTLTRNSDVLDGVSGWEEHIVIDAAIKALRKQRLDAGELMADKAAMLLRIKDTAPNRDAGGPMTVVDVNRRGAWGYGDGF